MRTHTIPRKPKELDWEQIPSVQIDHLLWTPPVNITATAQICYDDTALYLHLSATEAHIRAEHTGLLGQPCEDSCLEFFFSPCSGDNRYFNVEFNPNCCMYLGIGTGAEDLVRLIPGDQTLFHPNAARTADGWEITYQIPFSFIKRFFPEFAPASGKTMRANFFKCGDLTLQEHYLSWNMVTSKTPAFHRTCDFGMLEFM